MLDRDNSILAHYFPTRRMPKSIPLENEMFTNNYLDVDNYLENHSLEKYCKYVWKIEADIFNHSNFIFKHGLL